LENHQGIIRLRPNKKVLQFFFKKGGQGIFWRELLFIGHFGEGNPFFGNLGGKKGGFWEGANFFGLSFQLGGFQFFWKGLLGFLEGDLY